MRNPYEVLGLQMNASMDEVEKAFRSQARKHHPDRFSDPEEKARHQELFKEISSAYDSIKNNSWQGDFNQGAGGQGFNDFSSFFNQGGGSGFNFEFSSQNPFEDIISNIFGGGFSNMGRSFKLDLVLSIEDTLREKHVDVQLPDKMVSIKIKEGVRNNELLTFNFNDVNLKVKVKVQASANLFRIDDDLYSSYVLKDIDLERGFIDVDHPLSGRLRFDISKGVKFADELEMKDRGFLRSKSSFFGSKRGSFKLILDTIGSNRTREMIRIYLSHRNK